jgi:predicted MFS family arabinose efflux permease
LSGQVGGLARVPPVGGPAPLVDFGLLRSRTFGFGSLAALTFALVPPSFFFVLALYLQQGRQLTALFSGVVFTAVGVGFFAAMLGSAALVSWLGRQILSLGALVVAAGCLLLAWAAAGSSSAGLLPGLAVTGFGIGMVLVPLSSAVLRDVDPRHVGAASGVLSTAQQVGGALGVAVVGVVFYRALAAGAFPHAFRVSLCLLAGLTLLTAVLVQLLPRDYSAGTHPA